MATYNFTVRATDNAGAYSDRNFNLTVNNTIYDRFVAVGSNGLLRSPDATVWTYEAALGGNWVWFGNKWLVFTSNKTIRTSGDGTNWVSQDGVVQGLTANEQVMRFEAAKFRNGLWTGFVQIYTNVGPAQDIYEVTSTDGLVWTRGPKVTSGGSSIFVADFDFDNAGNMVATINSAASLVYVYRRAAGAGTPWIDTQLYLNVYNSTIHAVVRNYNGVWMVDNGQETFGYTSVDSINWVKRTSPTNLIGRIYVNGRVLALPFASGNTPGAMYESLTAGRTWEKRNPYQNPLPSYMNSGYYRQPMASTGGTILTFSNSGAQIFKCVDDGWTWNATTPVGSIGTIFSIHARDGLV